MKQRSEPDVEKYIDFARSIVTYNVQHYYNTLRNLNVHLKKDLDADNLPTFQRTGVKNAVVELNKTSVFFKSRLCLLIFDTLNLGDASTIPQTLQRRFRAEYGEADYKKVVTVINYWNKGGR